VLTRECAALSAWYGSRGPRNFSCAWVRLEHADENESFGDEVVTDSPSVPVAARDPLSANHWYVV